MPRFRSRRRGRSFVHRGPRIQHSPAEMGGTVALNTLAAVRQLCIPNQVAGSSAGTPRDGSDRDKEVNTGSKVGNITIDISLSGATASGILEYALIKYQRQSTVPLVGVAPVPSSATVLAVGLQQATRLASPGWVLHFNTMAYTAETTRTKMLKINLSKFRMSSWRDGDYFSLLLFNRGGAAIFVDHHARYYEYR